MSINDDKIKFIAREIISNVESKGEGALSYTCRILKTLYDKGYEAGHLDASLPEWGSDAVDVEVVVGMSHTEFNKVQKYLNEVQK